MQMAASGRGQLLHVGMAVQYGSLRAWVASLAAQKSSEVNDSRYYYRRPVSYACVHNALTLIMLILSSPFTQEKCCTAPAFNVITTNGFVAACMSFVFVLVQFHFWGSPRRMPSKYLLTVSVTRLKGLARRFEAKGLSGS